MTPSVPNKHSQGYFDRLMSNAREAIKLRDQHSERLKEKRLRIRANAGGLSLVSYDPDTPQLGPKKGKSVLTVTEKNIKRLMEMPICPPVRLTPEKRVQSALIREACEGDGRMRSVEKIVGGTVFFITDELAFQPDKVKAVLDLLLLQQEGNAWRFLCVELKSERLFTKSAGQVEKARKFVGNDGNKLSLSLLASMVLDRSETPSLPFDPRGIVVWPMDRTRRAGDAKGWKKEAKDRGLLIIGYSPDDYSLTVEFNP